MGDFWLENHPVAKIMNSFALFNFHATAMHYDYLIVGQGIAGTLLAHQLLQRDKRILVVDAVQQDAASQVAAGIINPITGRHFVKSWKIDALLPVAWSTYQQLEALLGCSILERRPLARFLADTKALNDWLVRSGNPDLQPYLEAEFEADFYRPFLRDFVGGVHIGQAGRVRLKALTAAFRTHLRQANTATLLEEVFDYGRLELSEDGVKYGAYQAQRVIFAEGYRVIHNPYFNYLPFTPAKGDVLLVRMPDYPAADRLLKHGVFIVPLQEPGLYWVGSTYNHHYKHTAPQAEDAQRLQERLAQALSLPFEVVAHRAAVRPAVRDRRPLMGQHPEHDQLYLFNGLGAKGASLGPYWSQALVAWLEGEVPLDEAVDLARFARFYENDAPA